MTLLDDQQQTAPTVRHDSRGGGNGKMRVKPRPVAWIPREPVGPRSFRPDIEGMRALAVGLVVLYHAGVPFLPGGYVGVDVFFVISGFLITTHLVGELRTTGRVSLIGFYARRAKRLLPLATLVTLVTLLATWVMTSALQTRDLAVDAVWSGLFAMNIHLANEGVDYQAADGTPSALQHFWSLAIEEQFYLVWPFILLAASMAWFSWQKGVKVTRLPAGSQLVLNLTVSVVALASFAYGAHQTAVAQSLAYFATPARAWELAVGGLIAINAGWLARQRWLTTDALTIAGLAVIIAAGITLTDESAFPGLLALLPVTGSALIIISGLPAATATETRVLTLPPIQGLGKISYGLYLWHWPLLVLALSYYDTTELTLVQALSVILLAAWITTVTYLAIEDPIRLLPRLRAKPSRALALGGVLTATLVATAVAAATFIPDPRATGDYVATVTSADDLQVAITASAARNTIPSNIEPSLSAASKDKPAATTGDGVSCMVDLLDTAVSRDPSGSCVFGDPSASRTIALTGDSHAYEWFPALEELAVERHWRLINLTKSGCTLYDVQVVNSMLKRDYAECYSWRENVYQRLAQEKPAQIITSSFTGSVNADSSFTSRWVKGVASTVKKLKALGGRVTVLADTPYPALDVPDCLATHTAEATRCAVLRSTAFSDPKRRTLGAQAAQKAGAKVIDPMPWFCSSISCPAIIGNTVVYSDNSHMTRSFARQLMTRLELALRMPGSLVEGPSKVSSPA